MNANRRPMTAEEYRRAQARAMTERQLLDGILGTPRNPGIALAYGWLGYHTHRSEHSPAGFPDLVLVKGGRLVFAELKKQQRSEPTAEQERWLEELGRVEFRVEHVKMWCEQGDGGDLGPLVAVYLWRPMDLLDGTIEAALRPDTPTKGLALPPRTR